MPSIETLSVFFLASIILALTPGPDNIFVLTQSIIKGYTAGLIITLGLCSGLVVHTLIVTVGIAAIIKSSSIAFMTLKVVGAGYLLYLAYGMFTTKTQKITNKNVCLNNWQLYKTGIIMNVTNPKVSIFFLAFLPQFINTELDSINSQIVILGLVFVIAALLVFSSVAILAKLVNKLLVKAGNSQQTLNKTAGLVCILLAVNLVIN